MKLLISITLFSVFIFSTNAHAITTARELQANCEKATEILQKGPEAISGPDDMYGVGICMGIVEATTFQYIVDLKKASCETETIPVMKGVGAFLSHIASNPGRANNPAAQEVWMELSQQIPCKGSE